MCPLFYDSIKMWLALERAQFELQAAQGEREAEDSLPYHTWWMERAIAGGKLEWAVDTRARGGPYKHGQSFVAAIRGRRYASYRQAFPANPQKCLILAGDTLQYMQRLTTGGLDT